jgi:hypothetical protein
LIGVDTRSFERLAGAPSVGTRKFDAASPRYLVAANREKDVVAAP